MFMMPGSTGGRAPSAAALTFWTLFAWCVTAPLARADGYWMCEEGAWVATGRPLHAMPLKACGSKLEMPGTRSACQDAGGRWDRFGLFPWEICRVPTHDGGRTCADTEECEGTCLASLMREQIDLLRKHRKLKILGKCTPHVPVFGCMALVERGIVSRMLCLD
jgi:hypothetical protein